MRFSAPNWTLRPPGDAKPVPAPAAPSSWRALGFVFHGHGGSFSTGNCPWKALCLSSCCCVLMMMMMMTTFISFSSSSSCSCPVAISFHLLPSPSLGFPTGVRWLYNLQWLFPEFHISPPSHEGISQLHEFTTFVIISGHFWGRAEVAGAGQWRGLVACPELGVVPARLPLSAARGLAESLCFHGFPLDLDKPGLMPEAGGR